MRLNRLLTAATLASLIALGACDMPRNESTTPKVGSLTQNLTMVDGTGRVYGSVLLDPVNGGKVFDADGRLIGRVITPAYPAQ